VFHLWYSARGNIDITVFYIFYVLQILTYLKDSCKVSALNNVRICEVGGSHFNNGLPLGQEG
jgi:hypothetical protein